MEKIEMEDLKKAMITLAEWAKQNNADYVSVYWLERNPCDMMDVIDITYTLKGTDRYNKDGSKNYNYFKGIRINIKEI